MGRQQNSRKIFAIGMGGSSQTRSRCNGGMKHDEENKNEVNNGGESLPLACPRGENWLYLAMTAACDSKGGTRKEEGGDGGALHGHELRVQHIPRPNTLGRRSSGPSG